MIYLRVKLDSESIDHQSEYIEELFRIEKQVQGENEDENERIY